MREIEFRAKTIPKLLGVIDGTPQYANSEWVYGYYAPTYLFEKDGEIKNTYCIISDKFIGKQEMMGCGVNSGLPMVYDIMQETLGQYIGRKDKNGKKIFQGDILEYEFEDIGKQKAYVVWNDKYCSFTLEVISENFGYAPIESGVVIGNVYDNPELLKGE